MIALWMALAAVALFVLNGIGFLILRAWLRRQPEEKRFNLLSRWFGDE